jgi:hypothetical protein
LEFLIFPFSAFFEVWTFGVWDLARPLSISVSLRDRGLNFF